MIRAVLDTSVLVPAWLRVDLQSLAQDGAFTAIWSPWIIGELHRTLTWHWLARRASHVITSAGDPVTACDVSVANWL
ncbi:MAG TPA: PIN domain-containing protein, partial [Chloroflexota bacterium]|nr:PIN domain-containing protein [Chloroflexota bacterium]